MVESALLSRFTPSLLSGEALEHLFVQRERLAARLVAGLRESAVTANKHFFLVTGPRGIGKTHLVSLVYHRLKGDDELGRTLRVAWLREEEWGVASYLDFLLVVLRALQEEGQDPELAERYEDLRGLKNASTARTEAERLLVDSAADRTILIIVENLDEIFRGLERQGQQELRAFLQNHPSFTILGTAQSLFDEVTSREEPFYGFFDTFQLDELEFENAVELVQKIAEREGDEELVELLSKPLGRARLRAVHHLAAGNPRVYVVFSQFLSAEALEDLVEPFIQTLDDLTPYYQSRMASLSPQQRKIVGYLCDRRGAVNVSEIADANFLAPQTTSSQLRRLSELGYVRSEKVGRSSYYELREPLLRLTLEVKKLRGGPVRLIVDFLRLWYSENELSQRLAVAALGRIEEGKEVLVSARSGDARASLGLAVSEGLVAGLYSEPLDETEHRAAIEWIVGTFHEYGRLGELGVGLVASIRSMARAESSTSRLKRWLRSWREVGEGRAELQIPLELLAAAVGFLSGEGEKALQELPSEHRSIVRDLLTREDASDHLDPTTRLRPDAPSDDPPRA